MIHEMPCFHSGAILEARHSVGQITITCAKTGMQWFVHVGEQSCGRAILATLLERIPRKMQDRGIVVEAIQIVDHNDAPISSLNLELLHDKCMKVSEANKKDLPRVVGVDFVVTMTTSAPNGLITSDAA